ncbi:MAG: hypothetical protein U0326_39860 [Polyangiales bacterium]
MTWSPQLVVKVRSVRTNGTQALGTGTIIAPGKVLTARHVVYTDTGLREGLTVERDAWSANVTDVWDGNRLRDVALLTFEDANAVAPGSMLLDARDIQAHEEWSASGWARVLSETPRKTESPQMGSTFEWFAATGRPRVDLGVEASPESWKGLSGAAIRVNDRIVAVFSGAPEGYDNKRLWATPVAQFWGDEGFQRALKGERVERDPRVTEVVQWITEQLGGDIEIVLALRAAYTRVTKRSPEHTTLVEDLVERLKASETAWILNYAHHDLWEQQRPGAAAIVWEIVCRTMPFLTDWRTLVAEGTQVFLSGRNAMDLPTRSETLASIITAGIDNAACRFAVREKGGHPVGVALLRVPVAASLVIDPKGTRTAADIAANLVAKLPGAVARRVAKAVSAPVRGDDRQAVSLAEAELRVKLREPGDKATRFYVVFAEEEFDPRSSVTACGRSRARPSRGACRASGSSG